MTCLKQDSVLLAIIDAKSKEEREAVIQKYGKFKVGKMLLKLNDNPNPPAMLGRTE